MKDIVYKLDAIDAVKTYWKANVDAIPKDTDFDTMTDICNTILIHNAEICRALDHLPSAQPEIIRCKDCRHNHDCNIQYHAQAREEFYCGVAERRTDGKNQN